MVFWEIPVQCVDWYLCGNGLEEIAAPSALSSTYLSRPEGGGNKRLRNFHTFSNPQGVMPHETAILVITAVITSNDARLSTANIAKSLPSTRNLVG